MKEVRANNFTYPQYRESFEICAEFQYNLIDLIYIIYRYKH